MPSASSQSSMQIQAPMEKADAAKAVLSFLEKKLRNLEKRKVRLAQVGSDLIELGLVARPRHDGVVFHMCFSSLSLNFCSQTKLSMYKTMVEEGKELNEDQKVSSLWGDFLP